MNNKLNTLAITSALLLQAGAFAQMPAPNFEMNEISGLNSNTNLEIAAKCGSKAEEAAKCGSKSEKAAKCGSKKEKTAKCGSKKEKAAKCGTGSCGSATKSEKKAH